VFELKSIWRIVGNLMNGAVRFEKCKQMFEYQHLLLLRDIWWSQSSNPYLNVAHFLNTRAD
jgi:hypothetical protein